MKVCIVSHNAYGAMAGGGGHVGGVEMQTAALAQYLAEQGHDTSILVWDEFGGTSEVSSGVNLVPICRKAAGLPGIKFFTPRWSSLHRCLKEVDADIYYHNGAEYFTGQIAIFCRAHRKPFVFSVASDADCSLKLEFLEKDYEKWFYRWGLGKADAVICQTEGQKTALRENFGRAATVLPMPCSFDVHANQNANATREVVWVGRIVELKRLEMYLDIAERLTDVKFHIAGGADDNVDYTAKLIARASSLQNVKYHGVLNRQAVMDLYADCSLLVCTSRIEGFPNTFLEAWGTGLPIVTSFDPDGLIANYRLGRVGDTAETLAQGIYEVLADTSYYQELRENALRYFNEHHERRAALGRFAEFLQQQLDNGEAN